MNREELEKLHDRDLLKMHNDIHRIMEDRAREVKRLASCEGKERFETKSAARKAYESNRSPGDRLQKPYQCRFCGGFHNG